MPFSGFLIWDYVFMCTFDRFLCIYNRSNHAWDYFTDDVMNQKV